MKLDGLAAWRSGQNRARKTSWRFNLEQLEERRLLAGSITIDSSGQNSLSPTDLSHLAVTPTRRITPSRPRLWLPSRSP